MSISKKDYTILFILYNNYCLTEMKSFDLKSIMEHTPLSEQKIRKTLKTFIKLGYAKEGALQHKAKTYYITDEGINKIEELL